MAHDQPALFSVSTNSSALRAQNAASVCAFHRTLRTPGCSERSTGARDGFGIHGPIPWEAIGAVKTTRFLLPQIVLSLKDTALAKKALGPKFEATRPGATGAMRPNQACVCTVTAVTATQARRPSEAIVSTSRVTPAPPLESTPPTTSTCGSGLIAAKR